ncbi:hypothetical protein [Clostridium sp. LP20]|uniref:hypothetical protein n=1 Tax=Clostridium sp. LP20 TaxID=3418665 RepID=UPI003EE75978
MDRTTACHNIAMTSAKIYIDSNLQEYKVSGYSALVEDLTSKYIEAYQLAEKQFKDLPSPKINVIDRSKLGL